MGESPSNVGAAVGGPRHVHLAAAPPGSHPAAAVQSPDPESLAGINIILYRLAAACPHALALAGVVRPSRRGRLGWPPTCAQSAHPPHPVGYPPLGWPRRRRDPAGRSRANGPRTSGATTRSTPRSGWRPAARSVSSPPTSLPAWSAGYPALELGDGGRVRLVARALRTARRSRCQGRR
jgi:hypothetical protein